MALNTFVAIFGDSSQIDGALSNKAKKFLTQFEPDVIHSERIDTHAWAMQGVRHSVQRWQASVLPYFNAEKQYLLVFDGWLENRAALGKTFALDAPTLENTCDSRLLALAYERWGAALVEHVVGEFAYAIWDCRARTLHAARDRLGIRPLFFSQLGNTIAVSNLPGLLSLLPWVGETIDEGVLAEFLCTNLTTVRDTLYQNVKRLAGAERLQWSPSQRVAINTYWQPKSEVLRKPDDELLDGLRARVDTAVATAAYSDYALGCELSGGIDSSSVSTTLDALFKSQTIPTRRWHTASLLFPGCWYDESRYINEVNASIDAEPIQSISELPSDEALLADTLKLRYPTPASLLYLVQPLYRELRARGVRVLLTGEGGDELFLHTTYALRRALRSADATLLPRYIATRWRQRPENTTRAAVSRYMIEEWVGDGAMQRLLAFRHGRPGADALPIDAAWAARVRLSERGAPPRNTRVMRTLASDGGSVAFDASGNEFYFFFSLLTGVERRMPLLSSDLVTHCAQFPLRWLDACQLRSRQALRDALAERLPNAVQTRSDKAEFSQAVLPWLREACQRHASNEAGDASQRIRVFESEHNVWRLEAALASKRWCSRCLHLSTRLELHGAS
jgi:asparagine synthetase B (glutamine-hydrolysing)